MKSHLPLNLVIYIPTSCSCLSQRIYTRFSFTLQNTTSSFMLVTELQHCKKNSITKLYQLVFSFQMFICGWASSCKRPFNSNIPSWPQMTNHSDWLVASPSKEHLFCFTRVSAYESFHCRLWALITCQSSCCLCKQGC